MVTAQGSGAGERRHIAKDGLLAIAFAETMRPIFTRWADDQPRELYQQIMIDLWQGDLASETGAKHLAELKRLPEFEFEDSNYRDHYVSMALELVHLAVQVVLATSAGAKVGKPWLDLNNLFDQLGGGFLSDDLADDLRNAASPIGADDPDAASKMKHLATQKAERVNAALAPRAATHGWTVERAPGEARTPAGRVLASKPAIERVLASMRRHNRPEDRAQILVLEAALAAFKESPGR